jgi:hypothetical protein
MQRYVLLGQQQQQQQQQAIGGCCNSVSPQQYQQHSCNAVTIFSKHWCMAQAAISTWVDCRRTRPADKYIQMQ